jgi:hypothetical protein
MSISSAPALAPSSMGSVPASPVPLAALGDKVAELKRQVHALEAEVKAALSPPPTGPLLERILAMTGELFPGPAVIRQDVDPDFPDDTALVMEVEASGEMDSIADRQIEWHRRMDDIDRATSDRLRLLVFPK